MALDGIVTRAITHELEQLVGARIHKIHQPSKHDLVFQIRGNRIQSKLLLSANPTYPRVHFTQQTFVNPMEAPMFCMLMRKHCEGGTIEAVRQVGNERILHFDIRQRDELGDLSLKKVIVELMGRHSNIILADPASGAIYDGIHHVTPAISSYRIVMPGSKYTSPPEQGKANPLLIMSKDEFTQTLAGTDNAEPDAPADKRLLGAFSGLSPLLAKELVYRAAQGNGEQLRDSDLWTAFEGLTEQARKHEYTPVIVTREDGKAFFSVTELTHLDGEHAVFESVSACLEAYYGDKANRDTVKQRVADLIRFLQNERNKNVKKLDKLNETLTEAKDADKFKILGELVTAYMHGIAKGDESVTVVNYYDENQAEMTIALDPQLTPSENAQRYFRRYSKQKNSQSVVTEQLENTYTEIAYLESLLQQLETASLADIEEIRDELVEQGYMRARARRGQKKKKPAKPALLCYTSSEGIPVFVGKNNTQNEYLTNRLATPGDTWLHTKDIPGSHVVIRGNSFGDATLEEAAMLAAHYSQARSSSLIPVDFTLIRHVRKPSGSKPGYVIYDHQKTLFITPDEQRLKLLPSEIKT
jgi:predicted ribosome quality control (RQC) complex YloA/Tae2 family protein